MPKAQDPHAETKEVAEQAKGATAVTGPSKADVAASEAFGEEADPLAILKDSKQQLHERRRQASEEAARKEREQKDREKMKTLGKSFESVGKVGLFLAIAQTAYAQNMEPLGDKISEVLYRMQAAAKENKTVYDVEIELDNILTETLQNSALMVRLNLQKGFKETIRSYYEDRVKNVERRIVDVQASKKRAKADYDFVRGNWEREKAASKNMDLVEEHLNNLEKEKNGYFEAIRKFQSK